MQNADVISMPDKWEYPWYAAWDLAFHVLALTLVDEDFGKQQLDLMLQERYLHPSGQIPAYEWNFGDVNPPVHAWSTIFTYRLEKARRGRGDIEWLERSFHKLLLNFTWWVNRKDRRAATCSKAGSSGSTTSASSIAARRCPPAATWSRRTARPGWRCSARTCSRSATELAMEKPAYVDMCLKFVEHFLWIASSMVHAGDDVGMWDEEDGFFYDVLRLPDGRAERLKVRSMVGLLPLCAVTVFEGELLKKYPELVPRLRRFIECPPGADGVHPGSGKRGEHGRLLASVLNEDEAAACAEPDARRAGVPEPVRHPIDLPVPRGRIRTCFTSDGEEYGVSYLPAESDSGMFGGNSNWRGPIWMPVNALIVRALLQYYSYYGDSFTIECPTGSGRQMTLYEVARRASRGGSAASS